MASAVYMVQIIFAAYEPARVVDYVPAIHNGSRSARHLFSMETHLMLNTLLLLVYLIPLPFWFLMIFYPRRELTQRVANNYSVFLILGALYVFVGVGAIVAVISLAASGKAPS